MPQKSRPKSAEDMQRLRCTCTSNRLMFTPVAQHPLHLIIQTIKRGEERWHNAGSRLLVGQAAFCLLIFCLFTVQRAVTIIFIVFNTAASIPRCSSCGRGVPSGWWRASQAVLVVRGSLLVHLHVQAANSCLQAGLCAPGQIKAAKHRICSVLPFVVQEC